VRNSTRFLLACAVIGVGGASGFFAAQLVAVHHAKTLERITVSRTGAAMPGEAPSAAQEPGDSEIPPHGRPIPEVLPDIQLEDLKGVKHSLADWKGHPLLINFWATWCEPCRREIPLLKTLRHAAEAPPGTEVIGVAVDFRAAVQRYARQMGIDYPVLIGEQNGLSAIAAFGMDTVFPFTVFADGKGRIVTLKVGELHPDEAKVILEKMSAVEAGRADMASARRQIADAMASLAAARARS
jgi:thiol-disulfide isomerase/thioredoxin